MNLENKIKQFEERLSRLESAFDVRAPGDEPARSISAGRAERLELAVDHVRARIDHIASRLDALSGRYDHRDLYWEQHIHRIEEELRELPQLIENGLRAVLNEPDETE